MRLAPIVLAVFVYAWLFLAALAWVVAGLRSADGPLLRTFPFALIGGVLGGVSPALVGQRGGTGLLLSFPLAFTLALATALTLGHAWTKQTR